MEDLTQEQIGELIKTVNTKGFHVILDLLNKEASSLQPIIYTIPCDQREVFERERAIAKSEFLLGFSTLINNAIKQNYDRL